MLLLVPVLLEIVHSVWFNMYMQKSDLAFREKNSSDKIDCMTQ